MLNPSSHEFFSSQIPSVQQSCQGQHFFLLPLPSHSQLLLLFTRSLGSLFLCSLKVLLILRFHPSPCPSLLLVCLPHRVSYRCLFWSGNRDQTYELNLSRYCWFRCLFCWFALCLLPILAECHCFIYFFSFKRNLKSSNSFLRPKIDI